MTNILQATAVVVIALGTGGAAVSVMKKDVPDLAVPAAPWQASHVLDGLSKRIPKGTIGETWAG